MDILMTVFSILSSSPTTDNTVTWETIKGALTSLTTQFSVSNIVSVIAGILTIGIGFVFLWWGARKGLRALFSATKKGKISV